MFIYIGTKFINVRTVPYKNLSMWEAYKMAIPFAWIDWIIMTFTVMFGDKYQLVTPTQDTFFLICYMYSGIRVYNNHILHPIL